MKALSFTTQATCFCGMMALKSDDNADLPDIERPELKITIVTWAPEVYKYGSMNLLSKADVEDNLMRVVSKDIAAELLEMTFSGAKDLVQ